MCRNRPCRCVLVVVRHSLHILFCPSDFSLFLKSGKPKRFHKSHLKLTGVSTITQTLSISSPLSLAPSATFAQLLDLYRQTERKGRMGIHGSMINAVPSAPLHCSWKKYILFAQRALSFEILIRPQRHRDPFFPTAKPQNWQYYYIPTLYTFLSYVCGSIRIRSTTVLP